MKFIIASLLLVAVTAFPQEQRGRKEDIEAVVLDSHHEDLEGGAFSYGFETSNGIYQQVDGSQDPEGGQVKIGSFRFTLPDGNVAEFSFTADKNGYNVVSNVLPQAPEMPLHAIEQIERAARLRSEGVEWNEQGFVI